MKSLLSNTFVVGVLLAICVTATDLIQAAISGQPVSWNGIIVAVSIAIVGTLGRMFSGSTNTSLVMVGSALTAIVPLIVVGQVNWYLMGLTLGAKIVGLLTEKLASLQKH